MSHKYGRFDLAAARQIARTIRRHHQPTWSAMADLEAELWFTDAFGHPFTREERETCTAFADLIRAELEATS